MGRGMACFFFYLMHTEMGACAVSIKKKKKFKERLAFKNKAWDRESQNFRANVSRSNFLPPVKQSQDSSDSTLT